MGLCSVSRGNALSSEISHHPGGFPQGNCLFLAATNKRGDDYLGNGIWKHTLKANFSSTHTASILKKNIKISLWTKPFVRRIIWEVFLLWWKNPSSGHSADWEDIPHSMLSLQRKYLKLTLSRTVHKARSSQRSRLYRLQVSIKYTKSASKWYWEFITY